MIDSILNEFRSTLEPHDVLHEYHDLFEINCSLKGLLNSLGKHCNGMLNTTTDGDRKRILECAQKIISGLASTVDAVLILSAYGRPAEARGIGRRITEYWYNLLFICTDLKKWPLLYYYEGLIRTLVNSYRTINDSRLSKEFSDDQIRSLEKESDSKLKSIHTELSPTIYNFPDNSEDLIKTYGYHWHGLNKGKVKKAVLEKFKDDKRTCDLFDLSYEYGYGHASEILHGIGTFELSVKRKVGKAIIYESRRRFKGIVNALFVSAFETWLCLNTMAKEYPLNVHPDMVEDVAKHEERIELLRVYYFGK